MAKRRVSSKPGAAHVVLVDPDEHDESEDCLCDPVLEWVDDMDGTQIWVHSDVRG